MYEIWSVGHKPFEGISNEMVMYDHEPKNNNKFLFCWLPYGILDSGFIT